MVQVTLSSQNWVITPAALALHEAAPRTIRQQKWMLVMTGVAIIDMQGQSPQNWRNDTAHIYLDMKDPLDYVVNLFSIPRPPGTSTIGFQADMWAPFATLNSIFDQDQSVNAGFKVDGWMPHFLEDKTVDAFSGRPVTIFTGIDVNVAVRDSDAYLHRVGYHITMAGRIVFYSISVT